MVNQQAVLLDSTFSAIATPARRAILRRLRTGPRTATDLWRGSGVSKPAISKHLGVLEGARLITRERDGRTHWLRLAASPLKPASDWLLEYEAFWTDRLDALERYLEDNPE